MAKQSGGYMGGFSGRLGPAVGYMWNGVWCLRVHQPRVTNPRTAAQVAHREMFKQEVQLAAKMRWAVNTTMRDAARAVHMTPYNLFVKANQHAFGYADGELQVDYGALRLSIGDVPPVEVGTMEWTADNVLNVSFQKGRGSNFDLVYLYVYVPELGKGFLSAPAYRRDRRIAVALPDNYAGCEAQVYLMVQHADGRWSESVYAGGIMLNEMCGETEGEVTEGQMDVAAPNAAAGGGIVGEDCPAATVADTGPGQPG